MKAYKFIFLVGFLNLTVPFLGVPYVYKNYMLLALAVVTIAYALILRAVEHEKKIVRRQEAELVIKKQKTIEQVVEMEEKVALDIKAKRKKAVAIKKVYE
jgi:hypothetical protein